MHPDMILRNQHSHRALLYTSPHPEIPIQSTHPLIAPRCYIHLRWRYYHHMIIRPLRAVKCEDKKYILHHFHQYHHCHTISNCVCGVNLRSYTSILEHLLLFIACLISYSPSASSLIRLVMFPIECLRSDIFAAYYKIDKREYEKDINSCTMHMSFHISRC